MANSRTFVDAELMTAALINAHLVNQVPNPGDAYDTGWVSVTSFAANFENYGASLGSDHHLSVRRIGMQVELRGMARRINSSTSSSVDICTLPTGFRPAQQMLIGVMHNGVWTTGPASAGTAHTHSPINSTVLGPIVRAAISPSGVIAITQASNFTLETGDWVTFSGITFFVG
jgi:hypothetical protein